MFSVEWSKQKPEHSSGKIGEISFQRMGQEKFHLCHLDTWAFSSCAAFSIQNFANCGLSIEEVDALFNFLNSEEWDIGWSPKEVYFLLSPYQVNNEQGQALTEHPNVKKVDTFTNKAHGNRRLSLFRYSLAKDFT